VPPFEALIDVWQTAPGISTCPQMGPTRVGGRTTRQTRRRFALRRPESAGGGRRARPALPIVDGPSPKAATISTRSSATGLLSLQIAQGGLGLMGSFVGTLEIEPETSMASIQPGGELLRPAGRCAAEQRDELAADHSITSSARASSVGGMSRPSAFAVLRLITSSNLVGACTGRSAGFSPLRMRSTYDAARRSWSMKSGP
jgi:hypothetical protein